MDYPMPERRMFGASPGRDSGTGGWVHADSPSPRAMADAEDLPSTLLMIGETGDQPNVHLSGVRLAGPIPVEDAPARVEALSRFDIVWLREADRLTDAAFTVLIEAVAERECGLLCEAPLAAIDRLAAAVPATLRTEWLVEADATDRLVAIAALREPRRMGVREVARDEAMERIDRLQEEVARIARLLGDLAGPRGLPGTPVDHGAWGDGPGDRAGQVRAPVRDYNIGLRSFEPQDRTIDRQRAKAVRHMLRQRRMREQYFPADLFADPAWDMLLDLYAARLERQPVSVSSLCIAAAVPATTALRWIKTMTDAGLFLREADPNDGRRIFIALAEGAFDAMACYFEALEE